MTMYNGYNRPAPVTLMPVSSENEARNYYTQPGGTTMFINTNLPEIYSKSVDFTGQNVTFKIYDMVEMAQVEPQPINQNEGFSEEKLAAMISDMIDKKLSERRQNGFKKHKEVTTNG